MANGWTSFPEFIRNLRFFGENEAVLLLLTPGAYESVSLAQSYKLIISPVNVLPLVCLAPLLTGFLLLGRLTSLNAIVVRVGMKGGGVVCQWPLDQINDEFFTGTCAGKNGAIMRVKWRGAQYFENKKIKIDELLGEGKVE